MISVSAVIITYNEEKNIARCLQSLQGVADEIIVVDSNSNDATTAICLSYNVKIKQHAFDGYASQKNYANSLTSCDYILSLDADEALSDKLKKCILEFKKQPSADIIEMKRLTNYCGQWIRYCGWYPDKKIRLWKRGKAKWAGPLVHEKLITEPGCSRDLFDADILHYSYYNFAEHKKRARYYAALGSAELAANNVRIGFVMIIIKTAAKFFRNFFILLGFLDGWNGLKICYVNALETYLKYMAVYRSQKE